jgi:hypothetical protein
MDIHALTVKATTTCLLDLRSGRACIPEVKERNERDIFMHMAMDKTQVKVKGAYMRAHGAGAWQHQ